MWVVLYGTAFLASQRLLLPSISAWVCLLPLALAYLAWNRPCDRNTALLVALYLSVDNGATAYGETSWIIRYSIYLSIIGLMVKDLRLNQRRVYVALLLLLVYFTLTVSNITLVSGEVLQQNLIVYALCVIVLCARKDSHRPLDLDHQRLAIVITIFLVGELSNIASDAIPHNHYLSYHSLKALCVFPAFYLIARGRYVWSAVLVAVTFFVLLYYGSRIIPLAFIIVLLEILAVFGRRPRGVLIVAVVAVGIFQIASLAGGFDALYRLERFRFISFALHARNNMGSDAFLLSLDRVREAELALLMSRSPLEIALGSGLGVGMMDNAGAFNFVSYAGTAFSAEELDSGLYYNFHDIWVDVGLRFGLAPLAMVFWLVIRETVSKSRRVALLARVIFVLMVSSFYTTGGVVCIAYLALALRSAQTQTRARGE